MIEISATVIADSKETIGGKRLTTMICVFPRMILAEVNTHRMFSRNSASSRAIPFGKMVKMVEEDPFIPIRWMKDHSGMQGSEYFGPETCEEAFIHIDRAFGYEEYKNTKAVDYITKQWLDSRDNAVANAKLLNQLGVTKQICNRLLEPFMWHTVIITASEWENFFALRANSAAEIHMQLLAEKMLEAYNNSTPKVLQPGEWHIPFGDKFDNKLIGNLLDNRCPMQPASMSWRVNAETALKVKIATARCARITYLNFDGKDDYEVDIKLHDRLLSAGHMSPLEHCARAMNDTEYYSHFNGIFPSKFISDIRGEKLLKVVLEREDKELGWSGNFQGFVQYRKMLQNENLKDSRVKQQ